MDSELERWRRELERLRAENVRLSRLLGLRGHDTAPAPEQLSAAVAAPGPGRDVVDTPASRVSWTLIPPSRRTPQEESARRTVPQRLPQAHKGLASAARRRSRAYPPRTARMRQVNRLTSLEKWAKM